MLGYEWDPTFDPVPFDSPDEEDDETFEDEAVVAEVIGDKGEPPDVEGGLQADPSKPPSLGDTSDDSSFASASSKGVRKRDSFRTEENPTLVERSGNSLT